MIHRPGGGIGRRKGLKPPRLEMAVRVRFPSWAHYKQTIQGTYMTWFDWFRIALGIPAGLAAVGLFAVLVDDIKKNK